MIIAPDYRGHRIEINATAVKAADRWNAEVRIRGHAVNANHTWRSSRVTSSPPITRNEWARCGRGGGSISGRRRAFMAEVIKRVWRTGPRGIEP